LTTNLTFDIYISQKDGIWSNPNEFDYDMQFKNMTPNRPFKIYSGMLKSDDAFVVAMNVHGYDIGANKPLPFKVE